MDNKVDSVPEVNKVRLATETIKVDSEVVHNKEASPGQVRHHKVRSVVVHNKEAIQVVAVHKVDSVELNNLVHNSLQLLFYLTKMLTMVMAVTDSAMKPKMESKLRNKEN